MRNQVYKNSNSEQIMMDLYDRQVASLNIEYEDIYVDTRFGKTHLLKTGNPHGKPVLLFHGGNSTAPYYFRDFVSLRDKYLIYAPDTIGHPGKSAQTILSHKDLQYGMWASDVIDGLGFTKMICMGGSYGGGVIAKLMCFAPQKITKAILLVPSGICNVSTMSVLCKLGIPMIVYIITKSEKALKKAILPMAIYENEIDESTLDMVRSTFNHVCVKTGLPSDVKEEEMKNYNAPTLLIAGEKDVLFPGEKVIARAKKLIPDLRVHIMAGCGHMNVLTSEKYRYVLKMITDFIEE